MKRPHAGESEQDFVSRFMEEMKGEYPDEKQRAAVAYHVFREKGNAADEDYPETFQANFIEPGLVYYGKEKMTLLVKKPALDKMRASFRNRPVINEVHREVTGKAFDFKAEDPLKTADGVVVGAWSDPADGWDHCLFIVWDARTKKNIQSGYSVSCAYRPTQMDLTPGVYHNIPYDAELLDGEYTHLAVVLNPRYEGAKIIANTEGGVMKIFGWFGNKKDKVEIKSAEGVSVKIGDNSSVPLKELVEIHNAREAKKAGATPPAPIENTLTLDDKVEIDGKETTVRELLNSYKDELAERKQAEDEKDAKEKKEKEDEEAEEKKNQEEKERKEKEDLEKKEKENRLSEDEKKRFNALKNAAAVRGEPTEAKIVTREDRLALGAKHFGAEKK